MPARRRQPWVAHFFPLESKARPGFADDLVMNQQYIAAIVRPGINAGNRPSVRPPSVRALRRTMATLPLILISLAAISSHRALAAVELAPVRVEEFRNVIFQDDKVSRMPASLRVVLALTGPEAESCVRYGDLKLEEAVDDKGGNLIPAKDDFNNAAKFKEYSNAFFRKSNLAGFGGSTQVAAPQVDIELAPAKRSATKIASLRGTFSLTDQGTTQSVELSGLKDSGSKTLTLPASAHLGITVKVDAGENVRSIGVEITGDESALDSIEVMDGTGHKISDGTSSWSFNGGPAHRSITLRKPLDNSMKLVAKLVTQPEDHQSPFPSQGHRVALRRRAPEPACGAVGRRRAPERPFSPFS